MVDESTASFLDKTDWRLTLHRKLEDCVNAEGTHQYPLRVKSLISAVSAEYPNWDARTDVTNEIEKLKEHYSIQHDNWLHDNPTKSRWQKYNYKHMLYVMLHKDIFEFIKNMCAKKRMLLWGTKKIGGGTQIPYDEE